MDELLKLLKARKAGAGIATADAYLKSLVPCASSEACSEKFFEFGTIDEWRKALKESENRLVYRNVDCAVEGGSIKLPTDEEVRQFGEKRVGGKDITPGSVMDFECVITSTRKDRDNDILEASGAEPDEKMPLLWQHMPMMPIGKLVEITARNSKRVKGHFAIADIPLGRDAAVMVEFGALRISHGFKVLKFERLEKQDDELYAGFHVLKFAILETSLVSVPSNEDASITLFSRGKLHHPMVKSWANELWNAMPKSVTSGHEGFKTFKTESDKPGGTINISLNLKDIDGRKRCGCQDQQDEGEDGEGKDAGKLGGKAAKSLTTALGILDKVAGLDEMKSTSEASKLIGEAVALIKDALAGSDPEETPVEQSTEEKCIDLLVALMKGEVDWQTMHDLKDAVTQAIEVQDAQAIAS